MGTFSGEAYQLLLSESRVNAKISLAPRNDPSTAAEFLFHIHKVKKI